MSNILVIGAGVVGQATGKGFAKKGHAISFADINLLKVQELNEQGFHATTMDAIDWPNIDLVMLTVSTPTRQKRIMLDAIKQAARIVGQGLATTDKYVGVVVRSTVPPSTTDLVLKPILEQASGKEVGVGFGLAMNPEFLRQRTAEMDFDRPWITVLGVADLISGQLLTQLYTPFGGLVVQCTPTEAETIKYVNNVYNAVKISYFNEVHAICEQLGIDSKLVGAVVARSAESMWNPLYGTRGGVPYGGACLPKDTEAFMSFCEDLGVEHKMLAATIAVNNDLLAHRPAAGAPDEIEQVLKQIQAVLAPQPETTWAEQAKHGSTNGYVTTP
ncbi:MAG: UDP-glucose/GDP-mannose dehydrogenase family protein [Caldilineaceae bacterium]|nr:UDP-glucose/GDP-mannose dehydrogenase family protein [Caldilineaceae bacterium]